MARQSRTAQLGWFRVSPSRGGSEQRSATIAVLARTHLTPQHQIHLVEAMDRTLLISTSPAGSSVLFTQAVEKAQKSAGTAAG